MQSPVTAWLECLIKNRHEQSLGTYICYASTILKISSLSSEFHVSMPFSAIERRRNTFACCEIMIHECYFHSVNTKTAIPKFKCICIVPSRIIITAFRAKNKTIASCCYSGKYGTGVRLKI